MRCLRLCLIALTLFVPAAARADVTPEQAQALEQQLHDWLAALLGTAVDVTDRPVRLTPDGDHYRVEIPMGAAADAVGLDAGDATITAEARPLPGDRWVLDDIAIPDSLHLATQGGSDPATDWSMKIADQHMSALVDPTLATASSFDADIRGQTSTSEGANGPHTSSVEHYTAHTVWLPTGNGRVDMLGNSMGDKLAASQAMPDGAPVTWSVDHIQSSVRIDAVAANSLGTILRAAMAMVPTALAARQSGAAPAGLPPKARTAARTLVAQLRNLWSGFTLDETLDHVRFDANGVGGSIAKLGIGAAADTRDGKLDMHLTVAIDGIDSPEIGAGPLHDYLPRHIQLSPHLYGVGVEDASQLLLRAIDSDGTNDNALMDDATQLLRKSPLTVGLDDVAFDLGPAHLNGSGEVHVAAKNQMTGEADITVTGLDALIQQAASMPEMKQALPILIMLKGLGRQNGDATHWKITYNARKILVNGNDLSAMLPRLK